MKIFYEVVEKIMDSRNVTVGGGSASAVAGAMAAGLVGMVSRLSVGKEYGLPDERYLEIAEELDELAVQLKEGAVEDTRSYLGIKAAFALPKATDEQKSARRAAIESAAMCRWKTAAPPCVYWSSAARWTENLTPRPRRIWRREFCSPRWPLKIRRLTWRLIFHS